MRTIRRVHLASLPLLCAAVAAWGQAGGGMAPFVQEAKLEPEGDPGAGMFNATFGRELAVSGDTLVVGAPYEDDRRTSSSGAAYVFVRAGAGWVQQQRLTAPDPTAGYFGSSVDIEGDTIVVGAPQSTSDAGAAFVFVRSGTTWHRTQKLTPSDGHPTDSFGDAVSLSNKTLLVGAPRAPTPMANEAGAAYIFELVDGAWIQQQKLVSADGHALDSFGGAVSIDGGTALVGAFEDDNGRGEGAGSVYVFVHSSAGWTQQAQLLAPEQEALQWFGYAVALSNDTAVVGAPVLANGRGAAYVFVRSGSSWVQLRALAPAGLSDGHSFGSSVSISGDSAAVGAPGDVFGTRLGSGHVFSRSGGTWEEQHRFEAPDGVVGDDFGWAVAIDSDTAVVGARNDDVAGKLNAGSAHVSWRVGTVWGPLQKLTAPDQPEQDGFSGSLSLSGDTLVVGAALDNTLDGRETGAAYVFTRTAAGWALQQKLVAPDAMRSDGFGTVVVSGDTLAVGATRADTAGLDAGAVYVFVRSGGVWTLQQKLVASDAVANHRFGGPLAIVGDTLLVGARGGQAVYVFERDGGWTQRQKLSARPSSLAAEGDTLVIGSASDGGPRGQFTGAAYVWVRSGGVWSLQQQLTASDGEDNDSFGGAVAVSGDSVVVGSSVDDTEAGTWAGSAYVFTRSGTLWTEQQKLTASDAVEFDTLGEAVAIAGDRVVVGGTAVDTPLAEDAGAAYVFVRSGGTWSEQAKLTAADGGFRNRFGAPVLASGDTVVAGAVLAGTAGAVYVFRESGIPDASLDLGASPDPVAGLQELTYTVAVSNSGPDPAVVPRVTVDLPPAALLRSAAGPGWACAPAGTRVTCTRASLAAGATPPITVVVAAPPTAQTLTATARVDAPGDRQPDNDGDTVAVTVLAAPEADLAVSKSGAAGARWGQPYVWTIVAQNLGPAPVTGASLVDVFPAEVAGVSWTCAASPGSVCPAAGGGNIAASLDLLAGGSAEFTATGIVQAGAARLQNTAVLGAPAGTYDPAAANDRATAVSTVPAGYYPLQPCRVIDTRIADAALAPDTTRTFDVAAGPCPIPADARALVVILIAVNPHGRGDLRIYPTGSPRPLASTLNFSSDRTRANNAVLPLGAGGRIDVYCRVLPEPHADGTHFVLDVVGYFR